MNNLTEPLKQLLKAINYRTAVLVSDDIEELNFANEKFWQAVDAARAALAAEEGEK